MYNFYNKNRVPIPTVHFPSQIHGGPDGKIKGYWYRNKISIKWGLKQKLNEASGENTRNILIIGNETWIGGSGRAG
jgi:hypothetical protein